MDINTRRLRCIIGWLAILLPWIVVLIVGYIPHSISITYYQFLTASPIFMIVLGSASILLIAYKGYETVDDVLNTAAAICGLGVCLGCAVKTAISSTDNPEYWHVCKAGPVFQAKDVEI